MIPVQALCQLELHTEQLEASLRFFAESFGWHAVPIGLHEYTVLAVPDDCPYGISLVRRSPASATDPIENRSSVVPYFRCEGPIEPLLERIRHAGGRLLWGPRQVPAYGLVYMAVDPGGICIGLFTPSPGRSLPAEPSD